MWTSRQAVARLPGERERSQPGRSDRLAECAIPGATFGDCAEPEHWEEFQLHVRDSGGEGISEGRSHHRSRQRMSTSVGRLEAAVREFRYRAAGVAGENAPLEGDHPR